jgi:hypothetical protein
MGGIFLPAWPMECSGLLVFLSAALQGGARQEHEALSASAALAATGPAPGSPPSAARKTTRRGRGDSLRVPSVPLCTLRPARAHPVRPPLRSSNAFEKRGDVFFYLSSLLEGKMHLAVACMCWRLILLCIVPFGDVKIALPICWVSLIDTWSEKHHVQ